MPRQSEQPFRFATFLVVWWWCAVAASAPLFLRILYEETLLTWHRGAQAIGFTMAHQFAWVLLLGLTGYLAMTLWLVVASIAVVRRRMLPHGVDRLYLGITLLAGALTFVPYSFWASLGGVTLP